MEQMQEEMEQSFQTRLEREIAIHEEKFKHKLGILDKYATGAPCPSPGKGAPPVVMALRTEIQELKEDNSALRESVELLEGQVEAVARAADERLEADKLQLEANVAMEVETTEFQLTHAHGETERLKEEVALLRERLNNLTGRRDEQAVQEAIDEPVETEEQEEQEDVPVESIEDDHKKYTDPAQSPQQEEQEPELEQEVPETLQEPQLAAEQEEAEKDEEELQEIEPPPKKRTRRGTRGAVAARAATRTRMVANGDKAAAEQLSKTLASGAMKQFVEQETVAAAAAVERISEEQPKSTHSEAMEQQEHTGITEADGIKNSALAEPSELAERVEEEPKPQQPRTRRGGREKRARGGERKALSEQTNQVEHEPQEEEEVVKPAPSRRTTRSRAAAARSR